MRKRVISIILCAGLCGALLAGCGSSDSASTGGDTADNTADNTVEEVSAEAETEDAGEAEEVSADGDYDEVELTAVISYNDGTTFANTLQYFCDYVTEHSGGKITFKIYTGGSFCTGPEELEYVNNGSIDVSVSGSAYALEHLPLTTAGIIASGGSESVYEAAKYLYLDNEETANILADEAAEYNLKILGCLVAYDIGIWSTKEGGSWETLAANNTLGSGAYVSTFQDLGLNAQTIVMTDLYESVSRGIVSAASVGLLNGYQMGFAELCDYVTTGKVAAGALQFYINLDRYNSLTADTQALLLEAADQAVQYQVNDFVEGDAEILENCDDLGIQVDELSQEDCDEYMKYAYMGNYANYYPYAVANGTVDEFNTIFQTDIDYLGLDLTLEELQATVE